VGRTDGITTLEFTMPERDGRYHPHRITLVPDSR
jgi:hypothetical protein